MISVEHLVGKQVGDYRVERLLGQGPFMAVYMARQPLQAMPVALTVFLFPPQLAQEQHRLFVQRFLRVAATLVPLRHPQVLPVYKYGVHLGLPYLVVPYTMYGSLAHQLKRRGCYSPLEALKIVGPVLAGLDYAHSKGVIHGTLRPANILLNEQRELVVAGFGLMHIRQRLDLEQSEQPYAHLFSLADTFLFAPEYLAPEVVQGHPVDVCAEVYAVGIIFYELLAGKPPFIGDDPLEVARLHVDRSIPSLRLVCPDVSEALANVVHRALERDRARRFPHVQAFAQALLQACPGAISPLWLQITRQEHLEGISSEKTTTDAWQLRPPVITGQFSAIKQTGKEGTPRHAPHGSHEPSQHLFARTTDEVSALPSRVCREEQSQQAPEAVAWQPGPDQPHSFPPVPPSPSKPQPRLRPSMSRRQVMTLLAAGGVGVAGVLVVSTTPFARLVSTMFSMLSSQRAGTLSATTASMQMQGMQPAKGKQPQAVMDHTGTVVGSFNQAFNSAVDFQNPINHHESTLIHLPNGDFVAYEKACTPGGDQVRYDTETHTLVCTATGARFDPANKGAVLSGPATRPLPAVAVRMNPDGTITVG